MNTREFEKIVERIESLKRTSERAKGVLAHLREEMKEKTGCDCPEEARRLAEKKRTEAAKLRKRIKGMQSSFIERWGHDL